MKETFKSYSGYITFTKEGKIHRDCGPSDVWEDGSVFFCKEGKLHRKCGPHWVGWNGSVYFGKYHRDCGPPRIYFDGKKRFSSSTPESVIPLLLLEWEKKYERDF